MSLPVAMPSDLRTDRNVFSMESESTGGVERRRGIVNLTVDIPSSNRTAQESGVDKRPWARWWTPEFVCYDVLACIVVPWMVWVPVSLSSPSHPNYQYYHWRLTDGWLFGRQIDNSDRQYRSFRNNIPALTSLALAFLALRAIYARVLRRAVGGGGGKDDMYLVPFLVAFSLLMLAVLHGTSVLKIAALVSANYLIAKTCGGMRAGPVLTWAFNALVLFANHRNDGYEFGNIHDALRFLDSVPGVYPRWHISFNITMLRLVSFNMDYHWACNTPSPSESIPSTLTEKQRRSVAHPHAIYSFANYVTYALYPPLYIAGPIITFNDFFWQMRNPLVIPKRAVLGYLVRFLVCLLTMEFVQHFMYVVAIKDGKAWVGDSPSQIGMIGFWSLMVVWLKLLLPWRFFRLWALAGGIDAPENMVRCMANNYSTLGFWRSWHRSYNLWITRYIYIPLGGSKRIALNAVVVFSFVALWHDLSFKLLAWGWLVSLFIVPELVARWILPQEVYGERWWYRHVCALGGVGNILMMMAANLVGFVVGLEGVSYLVGQLVGSWAGIRFLAGACICLFVGVQYMFEYREEEMRRGIYRRC